MKKVAPRCESEPPKIVSTKPTLPRIVSEKIPGTAGYYRKPSDAKSCGIATLLCPSNCDIVTPNKIYRNDVITVVPNQQSRRCVEPNKSGEEEDVAVQIPARGSPRIKNAGSERRPHEKYVVDVYEQQTPEFYPNNVKSLDIQWCDDVSDVLASLPGTVEKLRVGTRLFNTKTCKTRFYPANDYVKRFVDVSCLRVTFGIKYPEIRKIGTEGLEDENPEDLKSERMEFETIIETTRLFSHIAFQLFPNAKYISILVDDKVLFEYRVCDNDLGTTFGIEHPISRVENTSKVFNTGLSTLIQVAFMCPEGTMLSLQLPNTGLRQADHQDDMWADAVRFHRRFGIGADTTYNSIGATACSARKLRIKYFGCMAAEAFFLLAMLDFSGLETVVFENCSGVADIDFTLLLVISAITYRCRVPDVVVVDSNRETPSKFPFERALTMLLDMVPKTSPEENTLAFIHERIDRLIGNNRKKAVRVARIKMDLERSVRLNFSGMRIAYGRIVGTVNDALKCIVLPDTISYVCPKTTRKEIEQATGGFFVQLLGNGRVWQYAWNERGITAIWEQSRFVVKD
jgi:hypothetical protein